MQDRDDQELLREYVEKASEEAFSALVDRHINKVYSVALRHTRNSHQAEDVTQAVFVILSIKARELGPRVILSGWLYRTAYLTALTWMRSDIRRFHREKETHLQTEQGQHESDTWMQIAPMLDSAIADLNETDRQAVVLRFFDLKNFKEVGLALGTTEAAAQKRVNRALEKLRRLFRRRGVESTTALLADNISRCSVLTAPPTLAKNVAAAALHKGAMCGQVSTLLKGTIKRMAWTKAKTAAITGVALLFITGATTVAVRRNSPRSVLGEPSGVGFNRVFLGPENPGIELYSEPSPVKVEPVTSGDGEINLPGWHYWFHGTKDAGFLYVDSSDPATGANDLTLGNTVEGTNNCADWRSQKIALGPAAKGRAPLAFSFAYKIPGPVKDGENIQVWLRFYEASGHVVMEEKAVVLGSASNDSNMIGYKTVTLKDIRAPKYASNADIRVTVNFPGQPWTSGPVRFDDFSLTSPSVFWGKIFR